MPHPANNRLQGSKGRRSTPSRRGLSWSDFLHESYGVTVKLVALMAFPPGVVIPILPLLAPVGTVAVTCVSEFTVTVVATTAPKVTFVVLMRPVPVIATDVPTGPLEGLKLFTTGV